MSAPYRSITNLYERDPNNKRLLSTEFSKPEFALLREIVWVFTEKVDRTNTRVIWDGQSLEVRGRSDDDHAYAKHFPMIRNMFTEAQFAEKFGEKPVTLYGELYGNGINKGQKYRDDVGWIMFDAQINGFFLEQNNLQALGDSLSVDVVPVIQQSSLDNGRLTVKLGLDSQVATWCGRGKVEAEGLIGKPAVQLFDKFGERIIVKIKTRDYR